MKTKVFYLVVSTPAMIVKIGELMSQCDLGINGLRMPVKKEWVITTKSKVDTKYINKMKKAIKLGLISIGEEPISIKYLRKEIIK